MFIKEFIVIDKSLAQANKGNKEVLQSNARSRVMLVTPGYISDKADATLSGIIKKVSEMKPNETLLSKVISYGRENTPCDECIQQIENALEELDQQLTSNNSLDDLLYELKQNKYNINLN